MDKKFLLSVLAAAIFCSESIGADFALKVAEKPAPKEIDVSIQALLQPKAVQLLEGDKAVFEFWFVRELPLTAKPASAPKALDSVKQTTLFGVVSVARSARDYRDDELAAGTYTLRLGLQPQDGNHLGTAEFPYFAILIPAKIDKSPDGIKDYKPMVKASSKETSTDHPVILSLFPAGDGAGEPKLTQPAPDHKAVHVTLPAKAAGESSKISFNIVYEGKAKK